MIFSIIVCSPLQLAAQEVLTLEQCLDLAVDNNLDVKIAQNNLVAARTSKTASYMNYLPSISANMDYSWYTGTFFDTQIDKLVTETTGSSDPRLEGSVVIFNGFANHHNRLNANFLHEAAKHGLEDSKLQIQVQTLGFYLNVLTSGENIKVSEERIELLEKQMERARLRAEIGVDNRENYYNFKSQLAAERLTLVQQQNTFKSNKLQLLQALQIEDFNQYDFAPIAVDAGNLNTSSIDYQVLIADIVANSPGIKQAAASRRASKHAYKQSKSDYFPRLTFGAGFYSRYSTNGAINANEDLVEASFLDQLEFNEGFGRGFNISIPIFNRWQTKATVQNARITMFNAELQEKQAYNRVVNTVQQAYLDLEAAIASFNASEDNLESFTQSFEFNETSFDAGQLDFYSYFESLNNKNTAELQLINAKYTIILRKKILDLYLAQ